MNSTPLFCRIDQYTLLLIQGPDASQFLQGQVTCDIDKLTITSRDTERSSTLGAHCTHKGRVIFSFRALALDEHTIALQIPIDMIDIASAALQKYIVFSKAEIINAQEQYQLIGIYGNNANNCVSQLLSNAPIPDVANSALQTPHGISVCLSEQRYELWLSNEQAQSLNDQINASEPHSHHLWNELNITAGIPEIHPTSSALFTPHALNLHTFAESISFQKGCYTGQEVVARMHYLGKLKRQMFLFELTTAAALTSPTIQAGDSIYSADTSQAVGEIVSAMRTNDHILILASAKIDKVENGTLYLDNQHQHLLTQRSFSG
jgi:hypothetical protein